MSKQSEPVTSDLVRDLAGTAEFGAALPSGDGTLDVVRSLVLGDQVERMRSLEQSILVAVADLRSFVEDEYRALNERVDAEELARSIELTSLAKDLEDRAAAVDSSVRNVQSELNRATEGLATRIEEEAETTRKHADATYQEMSTQLSIHESAHVEQNVDRSGLANLLQRMSDELAGEATA